jgi:Fe-Mn family superoxide dismutase
MPFVLSPLPYDKTALSPTISAPTMELHHGKLHRGYVDNLNHLTENSPLSSMRLEEVIARSWGNPDAKAIFNTAAQAWNHDFYWHSMSPAGGMRMFDCVRTRIEADFGSYEKFEQKFVEAAVGQFGSGWGWLVADSGKLKVVATDDAITPAVLGLQPLLNCDLWEHAYYLDYQNDREKFVRAFLSRLANWNFVDEQLAIGKPKFAVPAFATVRHPMAPAA